MNAISEALRAWADDDELFCTIANRDLGQEAACEIERLEALVDKLLTAHQLVSNLSLCEPEFRDELSLHLGMCRAYMERAHEWWPKLKEDTR